MQIHRLFPRSPQRFIHIAWPFLIVDSPSSPRSILFVMLLYIIALVGTLALIFQAIYTSYKPGVRDLPGPWLAKYTDFLRVYWAWKGDPWITYRKLKKQYGNAVRIGPNAILLSEQGQFDKILGFKEDFIKVSSLFLFHSLVNGVLTLLV